VPIHYIEGTIEYTKTRKSTMVTQCCVCKKILNRETNEWIHTTKIHDPITHTYCPECLEMSRRILGLKPRPANLSSNLTK